MNNYLPIITEITKNLFFDYIGCLDIPEIDYFAIGIQSILTKKSIYIMSLEDWQRHFCTNYYAEHDPLRKIAFNTKRNFIPFTEIYFQNNLGKEIMQQRYYFGIKNGIVLMDRFSKYNYMITLGTSFSKFDAHQFIKKYYFQLPKFKYDLSEIIAKHAKKILSHEFIRPTSNRLFVDAK